MKSSRYGFTLVEMLIGSVLMLVVIVATLSLFNKSNKTTVDQQQVTELQHNVRAGMFFIQRDVRSSGVGLPQQFAGNFLEGTDNENQGGPVGDATPDRIVIMGNMDDPLNLGIQNYSGNSANVTLDDNSFEQNPYDDAWYIGKIVIVLPRPSSGCVAAEFRQIGGLIHPPGGGGFNERFIFQPGQSQLNPPGGLGSICTNSSDWDGGSILTVEVKEYWLDLTGNYPDPNLVAGQDGYIGNGNGNILYLTQNAVHFPLAHNIENLQFQYNGDFDDDGNLDGFFDWDLNWTIEQRSRISQVRIWVLGRTENAPVSFSGVPDNTLHLWRRPTVANTAAGAQSVDKEDMFRRFLLDSTVNIRNMPMNLNIYHTGTR